MRPIRDLILVSIVLTQLFLGGAAKVQTKSSEVLDNEKGDKGKTKNKLRGLNRNTGRTGRNSQNNGGGRRNGHGGGGLGRGSNRHAYQDPYMMDPYYYNDHSYGMSNGKSNKGGSKGSSKGGNDYYYPPQGHYYDDPYYPMDDPYMYDDPYYPMDDPYMYDDPYYPMDDPYMYDDPYYPMDDPYMMDDPYGYDDPYVMDDPYMDDPYMDDPYMVDDYIMPVGIPISIVGSTFSYGASAVAPVDMNGITTELGTVYLFDNYTHSDYDVTQFEIDVIVDGSPILVWNTIDGYCTRTGSTDFGDSANGYCHFTYSMYDPTTESLIGAIAAEGSILGPSDISVLTVTGGTEALIGTTGTILVQPSVLQSSGFPGDPPIVSEASGDVFDSVDGYLHVMELYADSSFIVTS